MKSPKNQKNIVKETVPLFFAVDDCYAPYLGVALRSLIDHSSPKYNYAVHILIDSLSTKNRDILLRMKTDNVSIEFVNVKEKLDAISSRLHLRDYYTKATYYRFFIADMFPQYSRGIYLDCDIVLLDDVAYLYNLPLEDNIVAAASEEVMTHVSIFGEYVERVLDISRYEYFSAGVLVMNLEKMREIDIESEFSNLLALRTFSVTQDQDYLNVICKNKVLAIDSTWNKTAFPAALNDMPPHLIHYKINWKPWHYDGVAFEDFFWKYAMMTEYAEEIVKIKSSYTEEEMARDEQQYENLVNRAINDIEGSKGLMPVAEEYRCIYAKPIGGH